MDSYEATKIVFSRIQALDPENASKITGYVLIQEHGEQEMIRLAFGPETLLQALILKAKAHLGLSSNTPSTPSTPSSPSPFSPISIPTRPTHPVSHHHSPRINASFNLPSPLSIPAATNTNPPSPTSAAVPWHHLSGFSPISASSSSPSYAAVVNGASNNVCVTSNSNSSTTSSSNSNAFSSSSSSLAQAGDTFDEYNLQDHLSFLNESSSSSKKVDLFDGNSNVLQDHMGGIPYGRMNNTPNWGSDSINGGAPQNHPFHRRSFSLSDACFASENSGSGFGWKPCLYYARGFCKNDSCKFLHSSGFDESLDSPVVGSPNKLAGMFDQCQEMLRSKAVAAQQHRLAAGASFPHSKCMNFLVSDTQRSAAAALMMGEEFHKFGRCRPERNDFSAMGMGGNVNPGARQIYLTFPADSTFREEDVSNYFSIYGPVQDVRIPYQQKRMFGFVTFLYPETVKLILAKGNPHFVCDSRVLVKPYKEKGKVPEKKQQHLERGEYSACSSPTGFDSREPYDLQLGARMFYNTQEMLLRRKLDEQADLQQAIELQGRRLMNLQLMDFKNHHHHHQHFPYQHNHSVGAPIPSPTQPQTQGSQNLNLSTNGIDEDISEENSSTPVAFTSIATADQQEVNTASDVDGNINGSSEEESSKVGDCDLPESGLEHILPDSLFASPKKSAGGDNLSVFTALEEAGETNAVCNSSSNSNALLSPTSTLSMAAKNSCSFHMPRFSSGNGAIEM